MVLGRWPQRRWFAGRPNSLQLQLFPEGAYQPAAAPLPRPAQRTLAEPNMREVRVGHRADSIFGKQRYPARTRLPLLENLDGLARSVR